MSYRKITVDGTEYEYVVGKTHTKIKGLGVFYNDEIGYYRQDSCECCGESSLVLYDELRTVGVFVTPAIVRRLIKNQGRGSHG